MRFWSNSIYLGGFNREPADNQIVQGITIIYPTQQPIMGNGTKTLIENVKVINFEKDFGAICVGSQSTVKDCYVSTDVRALTTIGSDTTFSRNLIVGFESGTPFFMGSRILDDLKNITFEDSTIVGDWNDLFSIQQAHFGNLSNFNFRNIAAFYTGDKPKVSLLSLGVGFSPYRRGDYQGGIHDVKVSDIQITALNSSPKIAVNAFGFSEQAAVRNVSVQDITVNGEAADLLPKIEQCAYNIAVGDKTIKEGTPPQPKDMSLKYPPVAAVDNPAKAYPRRDEDGDKLWSEHRPPDRLSQREAKSRSGFPEKFVRRFWQQCHRREPEGDKDAFRSEGRFFADLRGGQRPAHAHAAFAGLRGDRLPEKQRHSGGERAGLRKRRNDD